MNAFSEHHKNSIKFGYGCFDRLLLNGCIQSFLDGARAQGFFYVYRNIIPSLEKSCAMLPMIIRPGSRAAHGNGAWRSWIAPEGRRDDFVEPYFEMRNRIRLR